MHTTAARRLRRLCAPFAVVPLVLGSVAVAPAASATTDDPWWWTAMRISQAQRQATGKGVTIALIDSTLDTSSPYLQGADITMKTTCDGLRAKSRPGRENFHGSAMAALLVGNGRSVAGTPPVRGIVPDAKVLFYELDTQPGGPLSSQESFMECDAGAIGTTIVRAVDDGADVISLSVSGGIDQKLEHAVEYADDHGVPVVAAAGQLGDQAEYSLQFPAGYHGAVAVYAADRRAQPWKKNPPADLEGPVHEWPVITAPGVDVLQGIWVQGVGWRSEPVTGTSPATAITAGVLALVKSRYPDATGNQLIQSLVHSTTSRGGWSRAYGYGILRAYTMLARDPSGWPDVNPALTDPRVAMKKFPMSIYGAAGGSTDSPTASASTSPSTTAEPSGAAGAENSAGGDPGGSGIPGYTWPVAAAVVAAVAGGLLALRRRGSARPVDVHPAAHPAAHPDVHPKEG